jgi:hypothetical protein
MTGVRGLFKALEPEKARMMNKMRQERIHLT